MINNYFKVRGERTRLFWFDHHDRESCRRAFGQASATTGVVSVFFRPPISGEWDAVPAIVDWTPREMVRPIAKAEARPLDFVPWGEAGCW